MVFLRAGVRGLSGRRSAPTATPKTRVPVPEKLVVNAYDFAEQLLTSQRKFAGESQNVIEATKPLLGGEEGPAAKKGDAE
jgi:hypothetical protein